MHERLHRMLDASAGVKNAVKFVTVMVMAYVNEKKTHSDAIFLCAIGGDIICPQHECLEILNICACI